MRCEVVAIGTELLLGHVVDTNSSWIGEQLAQAGVDSHFQVKVGDNFDRVVDTLHVALGRSEAVIVCGGLGPTQDDITRECIAELMQAKLVRHHDIGERIRAMFESRGRVMPENNLRQADVPEGARIIAEMPGTAPGLVCPVGDKVIYAVPGVPSEMREMLAGTVLPDLRRRAGVASVIKSRVLRTWGQSESGLAEILAERIEELDELGNPTIAFLASGMEGLNVRITAKSPDDTAADAILDDEEARLRALLRDIVFGVDEESMEVAVLDQLQSRGMRLSVAEGFTGSLIASRLGSVPAAAEVLRGALMLASDDERTRVLGEPDAPGGERACGDSGDGDPRGWTAVALARAVRDLTGVEVGIAAMRDRNAPHDPARSGSVSLGVAFADEVHEQVVKLPGDAIRLRQYTVISLLNLLRLRLREH